MFPKGQYGGATHIKEDEAKNANLSQSCLFQPSPSTHTQLSVFAKALRV